MSESPNSRRDARREYRHAPIIDAIIELRFVDTLSDDQKTKVAGKFASEYQISEEKVAQVINVAVSSQTVATTTSIADRIIKRTNAETGHIVQIGNQILNVGGGAPYEGWDSLFARFLAAWKVAKKSWGFRSIERVGVRFINRLDLRPNEAGQVDYEDYLHLRIKLPKDFPVIHGYNLMFELALADIKCGVTVRSGAVEPAVPARASFLLDVDVWREIDLPQKESEVYALLAEMREGKNYLFETFITNKARELFNAP